MIKNHYKGVYDLLDMEVQSHDAAQNFVLFVWLTGDPHAPFTLHDRREELEEKYQESLPDYLSKIVKDFRRYNDKEETCKQVQNRLQYEMVDYLALV